tara:strand:+ start:298 stop:528 length:231 start_codon:yes stop_codon:yes gene_type:complete
MEYIKEVFTVHVLGLDIEIVHKGFKKLKDQSGGLDEVREYLRGQIAVNKEASGFTPYNNFECHFRWNIKQEKKELK